MGRGDASSVLAALGSIAGAAVVFRGFVLPMVAGWFDRRR